LYKYFIVIQRIVKWQSLDVINVSIQMKIPWHPPRSSHPRPPFYPRTGTQHYSVLLSPSMAETVYKNDQLNESEKVAVLLQISEGFTTITEKFAMGGCKTFFSRSKNWCGNACPICNKVNKWTWNDKNSVPAGFRPCRIWCCRYGSARTRGRWAPGWRGRGGNPPCPSSDAPCHAPL